MSIREGILVALAVVAAAFLGLGLFGVTEAKICFGGSGVCFVQIRHYAFNSPLVIGMGLLLTLLDIA